MLKIYMYLIVISTFIFADVVKTIELPSKDFIEKGFEIVVIQNQSPVERMKPTLQIVCHDEEYGCFSNSGVVIFSENETFKNLFDEKFLKTSQDKKLLSIKTDYTVFIGRKPYTELFVSSNVADNYTFEEVKSYLNSIDFSEFNKIIKNWKERKNKERYNQSEKRSTWK